MSEHIPALYLASELRAGKWTPNILQNESALRDRAAEELERLHNENEVLRADLAAAAQVAAPAQAGEYPPLPKTDRIGRVFDGKFIVGNCHLYEIHQMRAYVDADRAARGCAIAATATPKAAKSPEPITGPCGQQPRNLMSDLFKEAANSQSGIAATKAMDARDRTNASPTE